MLAVYRGNRPGQLDGCHTGHQQKQADDSGKVNPGQNTDTQEKIDKRTCQTSQVGAAMETSAGKAQKP